MIAPATSPHPESPELLSSRNGEKMTQSNTTATNDASLSNHDSADAFANLSRSDLRNMLRKALAALDEKERDLVVAAQIGQHLLKANEVLKVAYDELCTKVQESGEPLTQGSEIVRDSLNQSLHSTTSTLSTPLLHRKPKPASSRNSPRTANIPIPNSKLPHTTNTTQQGSSNHHGCNSTEQLARSFSPSSTPMPFPDSPSRTRTRALSATSPLRFYSTSPSAHSSHLMFSSSPTAPQTHLMNAPTSPLTNSSNKKSRLSKTQSDQDLLIAKLEQQNVELESDYEVVKEELRQSKTACRRMEFELQQVRKQLEEASPHGGAASTAAAKKTMWTCAKCGGQPLLNTLRNRRSPTSQVDESEASEKLDFAPAVESAGKSDANSGSNEGLMFKVNQQELSVLRTRTKDLELELVSALDILNLTELRVKELEELRKQESWQLESLRREAEELRLELEYECNGLARGMEGEDESLSPFVSNLCHDMGNTDLLLYPYGQLNHQLTAEFKVENAFPASLFSKAEPGLKRPSPRGLGELVLEAPGSVVSSDNGGSIIFTDSLWIPPAHIYDRVAGSCYSVVPGQNATDSLLEDIKQAKPKSAFAPLFESPTALCDSVRDLPHHQVSLSKSTPNLKQTVFHRHSDTTNSKPAAAISSPSSWVGALAASGRRSGGQLAKMLFSSWMGLVSSSSSSSTPSTSATLVLS